MFKNYNILNCKKFAFQKCIQLCNIFLYNNLKYENALLVKVKKVYKV